SATDYVHRLSVLQVELGLRSEYLFRAAAAKVYIDLRLVPSPDKYFLFQVVDDPLGFVSRETVVRTPPGEVEAANQEVRITSDVLLFSAEFAKRYGFATFRFGLIESTGGLGLDLHFLEDRLVFRTDLFDFANPETEFPRLKIYANLVFLQHLFLTAGIDDLMNPAAFEAVTGRLRAGRDAFVGGGIFFTDEDVKALFGVAPNVIP
ncbi:MAG TPA: MCE family protein, partial [Vulgatibacter sp.]